LQFFATIAKAETQVRYKSPTVILKSGDGQGSAVAFCCEPASNFRIAGDTAGDESLLAIKADKPGQ
jgi:arginine repressor